jgi:hypothetical protein
MARLLLLLPLVVLVGCATYTEPRPAGYQPMTTELGADAAPLFAADAAVLSDADITRILAHRYTAPKLSRIAILPIGWSSWSGWSEEMAVSTDQINAKVIATLRTSPRIYDASFLPSILVPEKRNVAFLREAAARYQADLLLVFRSGCRSFEKFRLFKPDEVRAFCTVEAIVLDTRTGLVPFAGNSSKSYDVVQSQQDFNFQEAVLRSQLNALAEALGEVSAAVVGFLRASDAVPASAEK